MLIIGCDFHTRYQQIAMLDDTAGEMEAVHATTVATIRFWAVTQFDENESLSDFEHALVFISIAAILAEWRLSAI